MSVVHSTIVGHFDPHTLAADRREVSQPIDIAAARQLMTEFPEYVADCVEFIDGYAECWWADRSFGDNAEVFQYAYRLAEQQSCIAAETPLCRIEYPESAKLQQTQAWQLWQEQNPDPETQQLTPTISLFHPPPPAPCPHCGKPLRTAIAQQCRFCKRDWHQ